MKRIIFFPAFFSLVATHLFSQDLLKLTVKAKSPSAIAYSHDNKYLAVSVSDEILLLNAGSDTKATTLTGAKDVSNIIFSSDNTLMATASGDKTIKLWTVPAGKLLTTLKGHTGAVLAVRFTNRDKFIVSIGEDKAVNLWNIDSAKLVYSKKDHLKAIRALDVSTDGKWIAPEGPTVKFF
jgi:COMPASS component SWD3